MDIYILPVIYYERIKVGGGGGGVNSYCVVLCNSSESQKVVHPLLPLYINVTKQRNVNIDLHVCK